MLRGPEGYKKLDWGIGRKEILAGKKYDGQRTKSIRVSVRGYETNKMKIFLAFIFYSCFYLSYYIHLNP